MSSNLARNPESFLSGSIERDKENDDSSSTEGAIEYTGIFKRRSCFENHSGGHITHINLVKPSCLQPSFERAALDAVRKTDKDSIKAASCQDLVLGDLSRQAIFSKLPPRLRAKVNAMGLFNRLLDLLDCATKTLSGASCSKSARCGIEECSFKNKILCGNSRGFKGDSVDMV